MNKRIKKFNLEPKIVNLFDKIQDKKTTKLPQYLHSLKKDKNLLYALNQLKLLEISKKLRKPKIAIYDHAFHFIGGAQKYGLTMASALQHDYDLTIITNKPVKIEDFSNWYNLDLKNCSLKLVSLDFFDKIDPVYIDPSKVTSDINNPFITISKESSKYDIFINNSMLEMVFPLSTYSVMICHFPERRPSSYFYSDLYDQVIYNSKYTKYWIKKRWDFEPHTHLYPPVDMQISSNRDTKKPIIISVARFELEGTKKQFEMIKAFNSLCKNHPELTKGWTLVLLGGSPKNNPYLDSIKKYIGSNDISNCIIKTNVSDKELKKYYSQASIFWHLCGLGQSDPAKVEHFGMTIAEAMQNKIVPLVFDGGGQKEIVENNQNGFRTSSAAELIHYTKKLITSPADLQRLSKNAFITSRNFTKKRFVDQVRSIFKEILNTLTNQI